MKERVDQFDARFKKKILISFTDVKNVIQMLKYYTVKNVLEVKKPI